MSLPRHELLPEVGRPGEHRVEGAEPERAAALLREVQVRKVLHVSRTLEPVDYRLRWVVLARQALSVRFLYQHRASCHC